MSERCVTAKHDIVGEFVCNMDVHWRRGMIHSTHYCPHQAFLIGSVQSLVAESLAVEGLVVESLAVEGLAVEGSAAVVRQPCLLPAALTYVKGRGYLMWPHAAEIVHSSGFMPPSNSRVTYNVFQSQRKWKQFIQDPISLTIKLSAHATADPFNWPIRLQYFI